MSRTQPAFPRIAFSSRCIRRKLTQHRRRVNANRQILAVTGYCAGPCARAAFTCSAVTGLPRLPHEERS
jgi:hypothetical protein